MKTVIKTAFWQSKGRLGNHDPMNIVTHVFWQADNAFIATDSKFLFKMVCANFFADYDHKIKLSLEGGIGRAFADGHQLYVYNLIYTALTGQEIENNILHQEDDEKLFFQVMLDAQMIEHQKRVLKIIQLLDIDFKKESDRYHRVLFDTDNKKNLKLKGL